MRSKNKRDLPLTLLLEMIWSNTATIQLLEFYFAGFNIIVTPLVDRVSYRLQFSIILCNLLSSCDCGGLDWEGDLLQLLFVVVQTKSWILFGKNMLRQIQLWIFLSLVLLLCLNALRASERPFWRFGSPYQRDLLRFFTFHQQLLSLLITYFLVMQLDLLLRDLKVKFILRRASTGLQTRRIRFRITVRAVESLWRVCPTLLIVLIFCDDSWRVGKRRDDGIPLTFKLCHVRWERSFLFHIFHKIFRLSCKFILWWLKGSRRYWGHCFLFLKKFDFRRGIFSYWFRFCSCFISLLKISHCVDLVLRNCSTLGWSVPAEVVRRGILSGTWLPVFTCYRYDIRNFRHSNVCAKLLYFMHNYSILDWKILAWIFFRSNELLAESSAWLSIVKARSWCVSDRNIGWIFYAMAVEPTCISWLNPLFQLIRNITNW